MKKLMMLAAAVATAMMVRAATETVGGYTWTYRINGDTAEVQQGSPEPTGALTIPAILGGKPVTIIGESAFSGCRGLTNVTIGAGVTKIGNNAFSGCSGLTNVTIPDSVTSIGGWAFEGCSRIRSVTIGAGVTKIGNNAFQTCTNLTSVTIPDSVTSIGGSAFYNCSGLTSVTIPNSVTSVATTAFDGCGRLWTAWYQTLAKSSAAGGSIGGSASVSTTIVQLVESPYVLTNSVADRAIVSVTVSADCSIDSFVLKDGKVYDCVLYVNNTAANDVTLTLPAGNVYKVFKGAKPLTIPAKSQHIITITRVADTTFLVSREELDTLQ